MFSEGLLEHLVEKVVPRYAGEPTGHDCAHVTAVMQAVARILEPGIDPDLGLGDTALVAAAYHDISLTTGGPRERHEYDSGEILLSEGGSLDEWITPVEVENAVSAINCHRASGGIFPATYAGCVLYDADRASNADLAVLVKRTWSKRRTEHPEWDEDQTLLDMSRHLVAKFGPEGYGRRLILARTEAIYGSTFRQIADRVGDVEELRAVLSLLRMTDGRLKIRL